MKPPSPSWNSETVLPSGGAELFGIPRGEKKGPKFAIGEGLTQSGVALVGDAVANMTIGDLESVLDFRNIDQGKTKNAIEKLRKLYFTLVSALMQVASCSMALPQAKGLFASSSLPD